MKSVATRKKISKSLMGHKQSAETIAKRIATIAPKNRGKRRTAAQKKRISEGTRLAMLDPIVRKKCSEGPKKWLSIPANRKLISERTKAAMTEDVSRKISYRTKEAMKKVDRSLLNTVTNSSLKASSKKFYKEIHFWLHKTYSKATRCDNREESILSFECSRLNNRFEWSNIREKPYDKRRNCFYQLCASCHRKYDRLKDTKYDKKYKSVCTGGAGFIGSYIAEKLLELGHQVIIIDDLSTGQRENIPVGVEFVELSLGAPSAYHSNAVLDSALKDADYVFHLAANPRTSDGLEDPMKTNQQTVDGTVQLLDRIRRMEKKPKIVHTSSCAIYGGGHDEHLIDENAEKNLGTPYAVQKYVQELYIKTFTDLWGIPSVMLRYFNVYGTRRQTEEGAYPNVIASFSKSMRKTGRIWITGDGTQSRDFVHVFDVVDANMRAMESDFVKGEAFNIGTGDEVSMNQIADNFDCPRDYVAPRAGDVQRAVCDTTKTANLLGWKAKITFAEGIKIYFNLL